MSPAQRFRSDHRFRLEVPVVSRPILTDDPVDKLLTGIFSLDDLLKDRLAVIKQLLVLNIIQDKPADERIRLFDSRVKEDRPDQCLQRIRDDRIPPSASCMLLPVSEEQKGGQQDA